MRARPDTAELYRAMCRMREVEQAVATLWRDGLISGEMHLGTGEEATVAGVLAHLVDGDAISVDYRSTPAFVGRGVPPEAILRELLGDERGLNGGRAGHMHLMSRWHLAAATGIVGATTPVACGFGLAAQHAGTGRLAVAFFGDGAVNEGMVMESLNLAAVWQLPILFVCKDNRWAITTRSRAMIGGGLQRRARGLGVPVVTVDGTDVVAVWRAAGAAARRARHGKGPTFLLAGVARLEGHFLGDPLVEVATNRHAFGNEVGPLVTALRSSTGAPLLARLRSLAGLSRTIGTATLDKVKPQRDPLARARRLVPDDVAHEIEAAARAEVGTALRACEAVHA